jgi:CheY-like chemotaxis protein
MSSTMVEQIFDPFFSTKFTGRGIGLPIVLGLASSHDGCVMVESKLGEGTTFRVCLPAVDDGPQRDGSMNNTLNQNKKDGVGVLLVEDEVPLRELATMMIESLGGRVVGAGNGAEALARLSEHQTDIDLVFCDIRMPVMDGWQFLRKLREIDPELPVVLVTAYDDAAVSPSPPSPLPDALLRKPYLIRDIEQMIEQFGYRRSR